VNGSTGNTSQITSTLSLKIKPFTRNVMMRIARDSKEES
jgi:hypothetical protein